MKKTPKVLTYIVFLVLGVLLLYLCFRNIDLSLLWEDIKKSHYSWMFLSLACLAISLFFRALRWNLMINALDYKTRASTTFGAVLIAYLANNVFPRLGEVVRCGVLSKRENIPFDKSFGTVVSERIVDMLVLLVLALLVIVFQWQLLGDLITSWLIPFFNMLTNNILTVVIVLLVLAVIVTFIYLKKDKVKMPKKKLASKISGIWHGFVDGIKSVFTMQHKWLFVLYTVLIWGFYVIMTWLPFYMFNETSSLGIVEAVTLLGLATLGFVAPVPGGIGTYHYIGILLLNGFYGISKQTAASCVAINHASQLLFYIVAGGLSYILLIFIDRRKPVNNADDE